MMRTYLWASAHYEKYNWARLVSRTEIASNNIKNANISHTSFELNCNFYQRPFYKKHLEKLTAATSTDLSPLIANIVIRFFLLAIQAFWLMLYYCSTSASAMQNRRTLIAFTRWHLCCFYSLLQLVAIAR